MQMSWTVPAADPFWLIDDVADADEYLVSAGAPFASTRSHVMSFAGAPLAHAGVVIATSAGAAPSMAASRPSAPKASVPLAPGTWYGVSGRAAAHFLTRRRELVCPGAGAGLRVGDRHHVRGAERVVDLDRRGEACRRRQTWRSGS